MITHRLRLAIVATHPIQHFVSFYRALSREADLKVHVLFGTSIGLNRYFDREMNTHVQWNMDLTSGYEHSFLPEADRITRTGFRSINNPTVWRHLSELAPDAVVVYGYASLTALRVMLWALVHGKPLLMISDSEPLHRRSLLVRSLKHMTLRPLAAAVAGFLTVGDNNEHYWTNYGVARRKMFRTPFSIDEASYLEARRNRSQVRAEWRQKHGISDGEIVFLSVGKLSERKRQGDMIRALGKARRTASRPLRLVLAGDGDRRAELEAVARELSAPTTFLGFVNVDRLPAVYCAADVLVHAASTDAHPLVFSEGACVGLPIIVSDRVGAVGPSDIAQPGRNAAVFPACDVDGLADLMGQLAEDGTLRASMGAASIEVFGSQDMAASIAGLRRALAAIIDRDARTRRSASRARRTTSMKAP